MNKILIALTLLASTISFATGLTISERYVDRNNNRLAFGVGMGIHNVADELNLMHKDVYGAGLQHVTGRLFQASHLFSGFEILTSVNMGGASYGKLFSKSAADNKLSGFYLDPQLGVRYLSQLNDIFDVGGLFFVGYGMILADIMKVPMDSLGMAWPLHFRIGPSGRVSFDENLTLYFSLLYTLKGIGSSTAATQMLEKTILGGVNQHGLEAPVGVTWAFNENFSIFAESNFALRNFSAENFGFLASLDIGCMVDFVR